MPSSDPLASWKQVARPPWESAEVIWGFPPGERITYPTLGKRKIIFKIPFLGDMLIPWRDSEGKTSVGNVGFLGYLWITYSGNRTLAGWKTDPD